jgi:hypothetical protein
LKQLSFPGKLFPALLPFSTAMLDWTIVTPANLCFIKF